MSEQTLDHEILDELANVQSKIVQWIGKCGLDDLLVRSGLLLIRRNRKKRRSPSVN
jgi:hypothetical protein